MSLSHKILSMNSLINVLKTNVSFRTLTTSSALMKRNFDEDRKQMLASLPVRDEGTNVFFFIFLRISTNKSFVNEGTAGEKTMMIDSLIGKYVF